VINKKNDSRIGLVIKSGIYSLVACSIGLVGFSNQSYSATPDHYDYPELMVVPKASDRLQMEASKEGDRQWTTYLPIQISAVSTLAAGLTSLKSENSGPGLSGIGVGAGWLALTTWMAVSYRPYTSAWREVSALPKGSTREQLTRERLAEEEIHRMASVGRKMKWLSFLTNAGAAAYMIAVPGKDANGATLEVSQTARVFQYASAALSLTPLVFGFHWNEVHEDQKNYKKRIYAPIASAMVFSEPVTGRTIPGMMFSMSF
jgi:hypothetical protein